MKSGSSPSARRPAAKRRSTSAQSGTDWAWLHSAEQPQPTAEHPEADLRHAVQGIVRRGLEPRPARVAISLRIEQDVLDWFKAQGPGYQTRINAVLRAYRDASQ